MPEENDEPDLLAFRYVAGELASKEARAFETRMADDQAAREAVSRAVGLAQRLAEARPTMWDHAATPDVAVLPVRTVRSRTLLRAVQSLGWMAAGAAAVLLIVNRPGPGRPEGPRSHPTADAAVWAMLQSNQEWAVAELERLADEPAAVVADDARDPPVMPELPSWVFAAASRLEK